MSILNLGKSEFSEVPATIKSPIDYKFLPKTGREYNPNDKRSYDEQLREAEQQYEQASYSGAFLRCERHGPAPIIFACGHCAEQDPVHPQGLVLTPYRYYLCKHCYNKHQLKTLDFNTELKTTCWNCILAEWDRIKKIDPSKLKDFSKEAKNFK